MATSAADISVELDDIAARRTWRWAAILLQVEALSALLLACLHLLRYNTAAGVNPMFALFAFLGVTVLLPFSKAIQRGSHGAGLVLAVLWSLRALQILLAPMETIVKLGPLLLLEGIVFGRALYAMSKAGVIVLDESARERVQRLLRTYVPIAGALAMITFLPLLYARELTVNGPELGASLHTKLAIALLVLGALVAYAHRAFAADVDSGPPWTTQVRGLFVYIPRPAWPAWAWADFAIGAVTFAVSLFVLIAFFEAIDQPGMMLPAVVIYIPIACILYMPLGLVWIGIGIAEIRQKPWTRTARIVASIPLLMLLVLIIPMIPAVVYALIQEVLK